MQKSILAALAILVGASTAQAQGRADSTAMTCGQAMAYVTSHGETVLGTGGGTYDRFVSDKRFCQPTEQLKASSAPTRDNSRCLVGYTCVVPYDRGVDTAR